MSPPDRDIVSRYTRWLIRWRWLVLLAAGLTTVLAAAGVAHITFSSDYRVFFGPRNPELLAYRALENTYTRTDNVLFVLQPRQGEVFQPAVLSVVKDLTAAAWQLPSAIRVDSLSNFQYTHADGDELVVEDLVDKPGHLSGADLARIRQVALGEPSLAGRLVATDARTTGVLVTLQFPGGDHTEHLPVAVAAARNLAAVVRDAHPELTVALTGFAVMSDTEIDVSKQEMKTLVPLMYGVIVAFLVILLRSFSATVVTLVIVSISMAVSVGLASWLGIRMNIAAASAPVIVLTLAIADSVHVLVAMLQDMRAGKTKTEALVESMRINAQAVFLTSLTTVIGFLSLNFSDSPPFHDLGNISAIGVTAAWIYTMTVLPALVAVMPVRVSATGAGRRPSMDRFGDFVVARRRPILWTMSALAVLGVVLIPRLEIDDRWDKWFDKSVDFRRDTDFTTQNLVGPYTIEFSIASGQPGGVAEPAYLEHLGQFARWLRDYPGVVHVYSVSDVIKRLNQAMHGDDPVEYRLPGGRDLAAQYLLLYEMSLPFGLDLNSFINVDKSATRLIATLGSVPSSDIARFADAARDWLAQHTPPAMHAEPTGTAIMFLRLTERNIQGMLAGTALAFALIAAVIALSLRSLRLGLLSLVSNFFPVLMTFGVWAVVSGQVGIIASVITATAMGLIVDDTVHILSKYNHARRSGAGSHDAVRFSFAHSGVALLSTTVILVAGFLVLGLSDFKINADLGLLMAIALVTALAVDFLMLPPLLMVMDRDAHCRCKSCVPSDTAKGALRP